MSFVTEVERMKKDLAGMKAQAEGLHKEYDRILDENQKLEVCHLCYIASKLLLLL